MVGWMCRTTTPASQVCRLWSGAHYVSYGLGGLIIQAIAGVLSSQIVDYNSHGWTSKSGIATGLACWAFMANVYLQDLDDEILASGDVCSYFRSVDDSCVITKDPGKIQKVMNKLHPSIPWSIEASGSDTCPFLDLALTIDEQHAF